MKMYVDEMPSCCGNCGFCCKDNLGYWCQAREVVYIADKTLGEKRLQSCPLQSLAEYAKQVRKKVVQEIRDLAGNYFELPYCDNCGETSNDDVVLTGNDLTEILDQIQGDAING